ncbi:hypothetical protein L195_g035953 [Trifolium pratense]|uniref:Uncharacterized protein n=1 Tax=Trifolium pratense TaxID=57577 RepID=A0A2K3LN43_TRIPR|nr:hypothetical protein L195_g035953 [Trifolium pratense]
MCLQINRPVQKTASSLVFPVHSGFHTGSLACPVQEPDQIGLPPVRSTGPVFKTLSIEDVINLQGEKIPSISVVAVLEQLVQVEDVHANDLAMKQRVDQQTPNLGIVGSWDDVGNFGNKMDTDEKE